MRRALALALVVLVFAAPTGRAEEDPYYVRADAHPADAPDAYDAKRDCAPKARDAGSSVEALRAQVRPGGAGEPNGSVAHLVPDCVAVDASAPEGCADGACGRANAVTPVRPRATYELSSGNYTAGGAASGNSGLSVRFDCRECPPPWESLQGP